MEVVAVLIGGSLVAGALHLLLKSTVDKNRDTSIDGDMEFPDADSR